MKTTSSVLVPAALADVWRWRETLTAGISASTLEETLRAISRRADEAARRFADASHATASVAHVAEAATGYGAGEEDAAGRMNATRAKRGE